MRRAHVAFFVVTGGLLLLLLGVRGATALKAAVAGRPAPPPVIAGRDFSGEDATAPVPVGYASLRCTYEGDGAPGVLVATPEDGGAPVTGVTDGDTLRLDLAPGAWEITLTGRRSPQGLGRLRLEAGDLRTCRIGTKVTLSGVVRSPEGRPVDQAFVVGCGERVPVDASGRFSMEVGAGRACHLHAELTTGALSRTSAHVVYEPFAPPPTLAFELDDRPVGGVGLALTQEEGAVLIDDVLPGTPGDGAGLLPGDRITAVDGAPVDGLPMEDVVARITGVEGTSVALTVDRDDGPVKLTLTRATVGPVADTGD